MRILIVSNFFPPRIYGGYEIGCEQVASVLAKNHDVTVLTSKTREVENLVRKDFRVDREFSDDFGNQISKIGSAPLRFWRAFQTEKRNRQVLERAIEREKPDVVYFWNLASVSNSLPELPERFSCACCCFIFDHSWVNADSSPWGRFQNAAKNSTFKSVLSRLSDRVMNFRQKSSRRMLLAQFPTQYLMDYTIKNGFQSSENSCVGWGVDLNEFKFSTNRLGQCDRILYVGQIARHKGVHLLLESFCKLASSFPRARLSIAGTGADQVYLKELESRVETAELGQAVQFCGFVDRGDLPKLYSNHDILVFPSVWDEPMGIVPMEAMASGLVVISSGRGGSAELINDGVDGFLFDVDCEHSLVSRIESLMRDPELAKKLKIAAREKAESSFDFATLTSTVESQLMKVVELNNQNGITKN